MTPESIIRKFSTRRGFLRTCLLTAAASFVLTRRSQGSSFSPDFMDTSTYFDDLLIYPRKIWAQHSPNRRFLSDANWYNRITIHHAGSSVDTHTQWDTVIHDLNGVLWGHMQKQYGDIAYHYVIDYSGRIWQGRSLAYEGAHVSGENNRNIGMMLLGNFEVQNPSPIQVSSMFLLVDALKRKYDIEAQAVYGHCDLGHSVCPGRNLYSPFVTELRQPSPAKI